MTPPNHAAFRNTACRILEARAADYVMWCAGHGADASTITTYVNSISVFSSHFHEWADRLSRDEILSSIPILSKWLPGTGEFWTYGSDSKGNRVLYREPEPPAAVSFDSTLPPVVATIVTLAIQQHILLRDMDYSQYGVSSQRVMDYYTMVITALVTK